MIDDDDQILTTHLLKDKGKMEGLTIEMGKTIISLSDQDHHNQHQVGGSGGGAEQEEDQGGHNKGKKKKKGGGSGGGAAGGNATGGGGMLRTPADVYEHPTFYSFILDMPGVDTQNIKVKVENGVLHVTGKRKKNKQNESEEQTTSSSSMSNEGVGVKALRLERRRARYMRKFTLPPTANPEDVKATYKDGVLTISISRIPSSVSQ